MERDPLELHDIARQHPEKLTKMYAEYKAWFADVSSTRGYQAVRIALGSPRENPTILTRQDWRGPRAGEPPGELGFWEVDVARSGRYDITLHMIPRRFPTTAHLELGRTNSQQALAPGESECVFHAVDLPAGPGRLEAWVAGNKTTAGVLDLTVRWLQE